MGRAPCCEKVGLKRGPWTPEEDDKLVSFIGEHGHGSWRALPKKAGLLRCGKSCRLRWTNYLRPDIKRGEFSASEEQTILQLHALLGNRWSAIASHLPKRTDNEIKNYWNTHLKKRLVKMGLDPVTHKPLSDGILMNNSLVTNSSESEHHKHTAVDSKGGASLNRLYAKAAADGENSAPSRMLREAASTGKGNTLTMHLMQWESVRLEAEARLTQEAQMRAKGVWRRNAARVFPSCGSAIVAKPDNPNCIPSEKPGAGAMKAVSAVELMNALHNWEKSLQGQAGLLWPQSWKLAAAVNQFSSCGHSESSSCSSPLTTDRPALAHTSVKSSEPCSDHIAASAPSQPDSYPRKILWSDALRTHLCPDATLDVGIGKRACGSFSSLMLDAVLGRSFTQAPPMLPVAEDQNHHRHAIKGNSDVQLEDESADADKSLHLDEASNDISAVTGDAQGEEEGACSDEDEQEDDEMSADGTSDLFKDLPRLKRDSMTAPVSYTAMLSEEISDYWSEVVLKEQVSSPAVHIAF